MRASVLTPVMLLTVAAGALRVLPAYAAQSPADMPSGVPTVIADGEPDSVVVPDDTAIRGLMLSLAGPLDRTGLEGDYYVHTEFWWPRDGAPPTASAERPDAATALESQLGLALRRMSVETEIVTNEQRRAPLPDRAAGERQLDVLNGQTRCE